MSVVLAIARADVLERVRRYGFLVVMGLVLWLGWAAYHGDLRVRLENYVGTWNSAWAGGMMALIAATWLPLFGFWIVKNAVDRDERTGVGPILATTPMSRATYVTGKALSHFLVLFVMACVLFVAAIAIQLAKGGLGPVAPLDYLAPLLFVVVPSLALTAAVAIFFEAIPFLRGAFGNVVWLFLFTFMLAGGMETKSTVTDVLGMRAVQASMADAIRHQYPGAAVADALSITMGPMHGVPKPFTWDGMTWTPLFLLTRLFWLAVAFALTLLAALPFHRFENTSSRASAPRRRFLALPALPSLPALPGLVGAELRLAFAGASVWWTLVALGLWVACWLAPLHAVRSGVLLALWIWAIPRWSPLGGREARDGVESFVLTSPGAWWRQPLAAWTGGVLVTLLLGLPVAVRLAMAGDAAALASWTSAVLFIPALALACGAWSGSHRLFEALYVALWYIGPLNRVAELDFVNGPHPGLWLALAAALLVFALSARVRRLAFG